MLAIKLLIAAVAVAASPLGEPQNTGATSRLGKRTAAVYETCVTQGHVALTYDDGPYLYTDKILDILDQFKVKATFFFNGNNFVCIYDEENAGRVQRVYNAGHEVASHSWAHPDLPTLSDEEIKEDLERINNAIQVITGAYPAHMRPPFGSYDDDVLKVVASLGQEVAMWNFDVKDADNAPLPAMIKSYDDLAVQGLHSIISLNHETRETTLEVLAHGIDVLQRAGYKFVTFAECIGKKPYLSVGQPKYSSGAYQC